MSLGISCASEALSYARDQIAEFIVKGRDRMLDLQIDWLELLKPLLYLGWCQWIGAVIFLWGWLHQLRCHAILVCGIYYAYSLPVLIVFDFIYDFGI